MGIKTENIPVYPVSAFDAGNRAFWFMPVERILEKYPFMEAPHKQLFYTLLFIEKASGFAKIDNFSVRLDEAKVICIKPDNVFSLDINRTAKGHVIFFTDNFFSLRYNNNVLHQFSFLKKEAESYVRFSSQQSAKWKILLQLMMEEKSSSLKGSEKVMRSFLNILLFDLERKFVPNHQLEKISNKEEKVLQFEKLIEEHFIQQKTPSWYAQQLHITPNYLNRLCQGLRNVTSGELIRKRVIIEAQRMLHYTSLSVAEIAYRLGFETPSYFITFFKNNTNSTPEHFRKNNF
ncbi:MAG TPA: AraC family transcriptional regulator [Puia sp.]|nr:AraC family transcriptional regulator [Puia sp.]